MLRRRCVAAALVALLLPALTAVTGCSENTVAAPASSDSRDIRAEVLEVTIDISPATLVLDSSGTWVTVHAEIPLSDVEPSSIAFEGITPDVIKADNRGELVAKFERGTIVAIVSPPEASLTLTGLTSTGASFSGTDTITVQ